LRQKCVITIRKSVFANINYKHLMYKFNVFHVRALYYTKTIHHQQMHKELQVRKKLFVHFVGDEWFLRLLYNFYTSR
jgi:hypothetical protein